MQAGHNKTKPLVSTLIILAVVTSCLPQPSDQAPTRKAPIQKVGTNDGASHNNPATTTPAKPGTQTTPDSSANTNNQTSQPGTPAPQTGSTPTTPPVTVDCHKADAFICKIEQLITEKTNKYRANRGLQPLVHDPKISFVSRGWSESQSKSGFISHRGFPSARRSAYQAEFGTGRSLRAENVAFTSRVSSGTDDSAAEAVAQAFAVMWWNSAGHRANMLGGHRYLGVGVYKNSRGAWYATQIFE